MIGQIVTDEKGNPLDSGGQKLSVSAYVPPLEVKKLFLHFQKDYQTAWLLQRKPLDEFDGYSLLDRARIDQETFAAFVGVTFLPKHKKWRFQGRKNTARNKIVGILARLIAGMLFPFVFAQNQKNEPDKMTAHVMGILIEEHLKKAGYEVKFMYFVLCMLVNPAVFIGVDYTIQLQKVKQRLRDGSIKIIQAVDEIMSGLNLNVIPIDELLLGDIYSGTGNIHALPNLFRVRRISYDKARGLYAGKHFDENGTDLFKFVEAGKTRWMQTNENNTLFDVQWNEADGNFVQEITGYYRPEDLQVKFVGGVFMGNAKDVYNSNPFEHRRMALVGDEFITVPIYPFAMSGFEPIDPAGRFAYYKSASFKEYWDDKKLNEIDRMLVDGVKLDVMKPIFLSGVASMDSTVIAPGATITMPLNARVDAYSLGPNLVAAYKTITEAEKDLSESTQDKVMQGITEKGITATQTRVARQQAQIFIGVSALSLSFLIKQVGELSVDIEIQHTTIGEIDSSLPESLRMRYKTIMARGKEKGREINNRIVFNDSLMGRDISKKEARRREWALFDKGGGKDTDQRLWEVNPYNFARTKFTISVDAGRIISRSMGTDRQEKELAFERLTDPRVMPFTDPEAVANDFVIEEYSEGDPERYKAKKGQEEMMKALLSQIAGQPEKTPLLENV